MQKKPLTRHRHLFIYTLLLLVTLAGCRRGGSGDIPEINIELNITPNPPAVGQTTVTLTLIDANNQPIRDAEIELEGNMSHAGMTPVFSKAAEIEPGHYQAPLEFTMGGDWFILVKATLPDGRTLERQLDVRGVTTR